MRSCLRSAQVWLWRRCYRWAIGLPMARCTIGCTCAKRGPDGAAEHAKRPGGCWIE